MAALETLGDDGRSKRLFRSYCRSFHTTPDPPDEDSLECIVFVAYLAVTPVVCSSDIGAPLSFRDPVMWLSSGSAG